MNTWLEVSWTMSDSDSDHGHPSIEKAKCRGAKVFAPNSTRNGVRNIPALLPIAQASIIFDVLFATKRSVVNIND